MSCWAVVVTMYQPWCISINCKIAHLSCVVYCDKFRDSLLQKCRLRSSKSIRHLHKQIKWSFENFVFCFIFFWLSLAPACLSFSHNLGERDLLDYWNLQNKVNWLTTLIWQHIYLFVLFLKPSEGLWHYGVNSCVLESSDMFFLQGVPQNMPNLVF